MNQDRTTRRRDGRVELYTQEPMVNWLGPIQLMKTAMRAAVATTVGAFADPREVQAALNPLASNRPIEVDAKEKIWVDYLADTGDGWDSTYSMALCVSHDVQVEHDKQQVDLPRGQVLLLGGDQVYPTPAQGGYRTRFLDPFRAALPAPVPAISAPNSDKPVEMAGAPLMLATPGNHDWYDGLRGFAQLFCNRQPIGGWETVQCTSYYVLKLCEGWWVWGLDLQLESTIDRPQRQYFQAMKELLKPHDRVLLCAPEPSWVDEAERVEREDKRLASIETQTPRFRSLREIELLLGEHLAVVLAGDSHHYARYSPIAGTAAPQRITCGGGGAFLHGTQQLPDPPQPIIVGGKRQHYRMERTYPDKKTSTQLRNRAWRLPTRNLSFCAMLAFLYLLFTWMVQSASKIPHQMLGNRSLMESLSDLEWAWGHLPGAWVRLAAAMAHSPSSVVFAAAIVLGCGGLSSSGVKRARALAFGVGVVHGLAHLGVAVGLLWFMGRINLHYLALPVDSWRQVSLFIVEILLLGGVLGGFLFGGWMVMANAFWGLHAEEVFSSQRIADHKCFLRMCFEPGKLTIYPLKLDRVCRRWAVNENVQQEMQVGRTWKLRAFQASTGPRFVPASGPLKPELIEDPIVIPRAGASA